MSTSDTHAAHIVATGTLVSIGYEGKTVDDLVARLLEQDVQVLVDVRLTPLSRKPGLSKTKLSEALAAQGMKLDVEALTTRFGVPLKREDAEAKPKLSLVKEAA